MMQRLVLLLALIPLVGCSSCSKSVDSRTAFRLEPERAERLNAEFTVPVGEEMISSQARYARIVTRTLIFSDSISSVTLHRGRELNIISPAGSYELVGWDWDGQYFELSSGTMTVNERKAVGGLFLPTRQSVTSAHYWQWQNSLNNYKKLNVYVSYLQDIPVPIKQLTGFRKQEESYSGPVSTLSYLGVSGGQIRFVYREFTAGGLARPAFTQELSLDYTPGKTYAYKASRFVVHDADSIRVRYTLLSPL
jgi:hypothetical protein